MDGSDLVEVLEDAGLSPYQSEAYVTLLELGAASATDIAEASDVPDPRIYDVLRDLKSRGFIETYEQNSLHARAHDPSDVLSDLRSRAEQFEAAAEEIEERWSSPSMEQSRVSVVSRYQTVLDRAREQIRAAENQIQLCATVEDFEQLRPALVEAVDDGVFVKLSIHSDDRSDVDVSDLDGAATEARFRPLPSPFIVLVDRDRACFAPHSDSINQYGVLVDDRSHTYVFHWFFLTSLWDIWDVVYTERDDDVPFTYVDVRYCIRDVVPLLDDGLSVTVELTGSDTSTGAQRRVEGRLVDVVTTNQAAEVEVDAEGFLSVAEFAGVASLQIDTGDEVVDAGGWGATMEDVEAERITVTSISDDDDT